MNKKILAISIAAVLVAGFLATPLAAEAATAQSKILKSILGLTETAKSQLENTILPTLDTIKEDLKFKKKFWQYEPCEDLTHDGNGQIHPCWFVIDATEVQVEVVNCGLKDITACAFNVESIQFKFPGACIDHLEVDEADFKVDPGTCTPTNLLVDTGIGKIGASNEVSVFFDTPYTGPVEFNGEKPQAMELCTEPDGQNPCPPD